MNETPISTFTNNPGVANRDGFLGGGFWDSGSQLAIVICVKIASQSSVKIKEEANVEMTIIEEPQV